MSTEAASFWAPETSVFFTSFWGWAPATWGTVGWTGGQGLTHRDRILPTLSDPFIAVIYVTQSAPRKDERGMIVGFYLMSHETGHRNDFTHPTHHDLEPTKWVHSLRALRAFHYLPEQRIKAADLLPELSSRAQPISRWGEELTDQEQIGRLREMPWVETEVYVPAGKAVAVEEDFAPAQGFNRAGPANNEGYVVSSSARQLKRHLYVLRLSGSADAYLGRPSKGKQIYKIGLSASPELRKQSLQSALPNGSFRWGIQWDSASTGRTDGFSFDAAVAGEDVMKQYLSKNAVWLGGEFYLASDDAIKIAWNLGGAAAHQFNLP